MIFLFILGCILESSIGSRNFLLIYFLSGVFAGIFTIIAASFGIIESTALIAGSSGAIFGVLAATITIRPILMIILFAALYFVVKIGFIILDIGGEDISQIVHIGGAFSGLILGLLMRK